MKDLKIVELDAFAMYMFCNEYDKLEFIPEFKTRIDTAKQNFKDSFLQRCSCEACKNASDLIINLNWYNYE